MHASIGVWRSEVPVYEEFQYGIINVDVRHTILQVAFDGNPFRMLFVIEHASLQIISIEIRNTDIGHTDVHCIHLRILMSL